MLLDPYAPLVSSRRAFGKRDELEQFAGKVGGPLQLAASVKMCLFLFYRTVNLR